MFVCTFVCMYVCMYVICNDVNYVCMCVYVCMYVCMYSFVSLFVFYIDGGPIYFSFYDIESDKCLKQVSNIVFLHFCRNIKKMKQMVKEFIRECSQKTIPGSKSLQLEKKTNDQTSVQVLQIFSSFCFCLKKCCNRPFTKHTLP